jgi:aryl-alcohol dehydrogenase-like predicted oxidoreductase
MKKIAFGKTGFQVSPLGFGAGPIGYLKTEQERIATILNTLLDAGVNLIDTAASYPGSEEAIGNAVAHRRSEFLLVSKCGPSFEDVAGDAWSPQVIAGTVDRALHRLRTDHLDVMLLHSCTLDVLQKGEAVAALAKSRDVGKIRFAGYSGDNEAAAYAAGLPDIAVLEMSVNLTDQMNLDTVLPVARKNNLGVLAKRPIANAAWKEASEQRGIYGNYASEYHRRLKQMRLNPTDLGIAGPPEQAWPELALRFTLSQPGVHTAIIGTTNPANARANLAAAEKGSLPQATIDRIRAAFRQADPDRQWIGQR